MASDRGERLQPGHLPIVLVKLLAEALLQLLAHLEEALQPGGATLCGLDPAARALTSKIGIHPVALDEVPQRVDEARLAAPLAAGDEDDAAAPVLRRVFVARLQGFLKERRDLVDGVALALRQLEKADRSGLFSQDLTSFAHGRDLLFGCGRCDAVLARHGRPPRRGRKLRSQARQPRVSRASTAPCESHVAPSKSDRSDSRLSAGLPRRAKIRAHSPGRARHPARRPAAKTAPWSRFMLHRATTRRRASGEARDLRRELVGEFVASRQRRCRGREGASSGRRDRRAAQAG